MSALPGGDETMLHSMHIVGIRRLAISDSPVSICWRIRWRSYPTTVVWCITGRRHPAAVVTGRRHPATVDVVSLGIPHSESVNTIYIMKSTQKIHIHTNKKKITWTVIKVLTKLCLYIFKSQCPLGSVTFFPLLPHYLSSWFVLLLAVTSCCSVLVWGTGL